MLEKKYNTEEEKKEAQRAACRRYYKRNAEKILEKMRIKYHTEHPNAPYNFREGAENEKE